MNKTAVTESNPVEFDDMQGLVRFGHGALVEAEFFLCRVKDVKAAKSWLHEAPVTHAATQDSPPKTALQLAFTASGLRAFGLSDEILSGFAQPFLSGMAGEDSRSRRLGDTGSNAPGNWDWDGAQSHMLLMLYARKGGLKSWKQDILNSNFDTAFEHIQSFPTRPNEGFESFGFRDGVSEPKVDWKNTHPPSTHGREDYSNMTSSGEVVLGYRNEYNARPASPEVDVSLPDSDLLAEAPNSSARRDLGRNGSFLVFRQLEQDVPRFWRYMNKVAEGDPTDRERLAAQMVGREMDGTPLIHGRRDIAGSPQKNDFTYDDDVNGVSCPLGAHIRRANPRTGDHPAQIEGRIGWVLSTLGFRRRRDKLPGRHDLVASTRFHRLVRRGRVYGSKMSPEAALKKGAKRGERGLLFVCLCADLVRQFEFVQNAWIASPKFNGLTGEADPLIGGRAPVSGVESDGFSIQKADGIDDHHAQLPQFVTVKGGGYFFLPGLRALQFIARHGS
jgi:Dyp-type peroxidase family